MGGQRTFTAGEVLTASNIMTYLMNQSNMVFASTSARDAALTAPTEGMVALTTDRDLFWVYDGSAWQRLEGYSSSGRTGCFVSRAASQTISAATLTTITFDTVGSDPDSFHAGSTFSVLTVPTGLGGLYLINARVIWAANPGATDNAVVISTGGFDYICGNAQQGAAENVSGTLFISVAAAATVALKVRCGSGSTNCTAFMDMQRLMI